MRLAEIGGKKNHAPFLGAKKKPWPLASMEAQNDLPGKRRVRTFVYTFAPWLAPKCRAATVFGSIACCATGTVGWGGRGGCSTLFYRPIEINANAVSCFAWVFVGQCEHKRWSVTYAGPNFTCTNVDRTLRLTKVHHIQWHTEVFMVFNGITTQQCRNLKPIELRKIKIKLLKRTFRVWAWFLGTKF